MEFFNKLWRYKDICCEITCEDEEPVFLMNNQAGTSVPASYLTAVQDEHYTEDLEAARANGLEFIWVKKPDSATVTMISMSAA